jgi:hypothetical protein
MTADLLHRASPSFAQPPSVQSTGRAASAPISGWSEMDPASPFEREPRHLVELVG